MERIRPDGPAAPGGVAAARSLLRTDGVVLVDDGRGPLMRSWPPSSVRALRRAIAAVDATFRTAGLLHATVPPADATPAGRYAVDLASRLRFHAGELRRAAHGIPCYRVLRGPCGLPERAEVDAAAATLDAMADTLRMGRAADTADFGVRAARLLGIAWEATAGVGAAEGR